MTARAAPVGEANGRDAFPEAREKAIWLHHYGFAAWFWQPICPPLTAKPAQLLREGWQRLEPEQRILIDCLFGQLAEVRQREAAPGVLADEYWVSGHDLAHAIRYPVALGFLLPAKVEQLLPSRLAPPQSINPFPPANLGQIGAVLHDLHYQECRISSLDQRAQALQQRLGEALRILQGAPDEGRSVFWFIASLPAVYHPYHTLLLKEQAAIRITWSERVADWLALKRAPDPARVARVQKIAHELGELETARHEIALLGTLVEQRSHRRTLYEQLWPEIRRLAHRLAVAYYEHAQPPRPPAVVAFSTPAPDRESFPALPPETWLAQDHRRARILADPVSQALAMLLRTGNAFAGAPERGGLRCLQPLETPTGTADLELRLIPDEEETWANLLARREGLADHLIDTWLALQMVALACTPGDPTAPQELTTKMVLETCWREKTNYGYPQAQRQLILRDLAILKRLHVRVTPRSLHGRALDPPIESPLLVVHQGDHKERFSAALGDWIALLPAQWHSTVEISRQLLRLHPRDDLRAKRLGLFLAFRFAGQQEILLNGAALMEQTGTAFAGKNPKRVRDSWMRTFKVLAGLPVLTKAEQRRGYDEPLVWDSRTQAHRIDPERQVIGAFWAEHSDPEIGALGRGYLKERWLQLAWHFQALDHPRAPLDKARPDNSDSRKILPSIETA